MGKQRIRYLLTVSFCLVLIVSLLAFQNGFAASSIQSPSAYSITMDLNPSIELKIENGNVVEASALNDDGESLLLDVQTSGRTAQEAVQEIVSALAQAGYLAAAEVKPYLVITVTGDQDADVADALNKTAKEALEGLGAECEVRTAYVSDEIAVQAAALGLSSGKYLLMQRIANSEAISLEDAIAQYGSKTMGELMVLFGDADGIFDIGDDEEDVLTEEQRTALQAAFALEKDTIKEAEKAFHDAFQAIKSTYRNQIQTMKKEKRKEDVEGLIAGLSKLKEEMLAEYQAAKQALTDAQAGARTAFLDAIASAGIPEDIATQYYNWHMNKETNVLDQINSFLKEFTYNGDGQEKSEEAKDKVNEEAEGSETEKEQTPDNQSAPGDSSKQEKPAKEDTPKGNKPENNMTVSEGKGNKKK